MASTPNSAGIRFVSGASSRARQPDNMVCPSCKRQMVQIFLSQACDYCDYGLPKDKLHLGFIVYRQPDPGDETPEEYVFRTRPDAERWREASSLIGGEIREVWSLAPFRWHHLSRGTLRDIVLADQMFSIFPDHKYEPRPHRAHFMP